MNRVKSVAANIHFAFGLTLLSAATFTITCAQAEEAEHDFHFRPFWVEPADRIEFGHGHLVGGMDNENKPEKGVRNTTALPLEATLGLGQGFSIMLATDVAARSVLDSNVTSTSANREVKLRYSFPEWEGSHFMLVGGIAKPTGGAQSTQSAGFSIAIDTDVGTVGIGQAWYPKRTQDVRTGSESAINLFRTGLGSDHKWGLAGELRYAKTSANESLGYWMLGVGRVIANGVMADVAIAGTGGSYSSSRITSGLSWFF